MKFLRPWLQASRITSQLYILIPLLLGQLLAHVHGSTFNWVIFVFVHLFGLTIQLYIVYANDYADREADEHNATFNMFSGGSRVLADGLLSPEALEKAAVIMAVVSVLIPTVMAFLLNRFVLIPLSIFSVLLLWMYSYPPVKMSYRGGGELLQMIGVGCVLPLFGFYGQAGTFDGFPWPVMAIMLPINWASGITTSLPDEPSDRRSGKKTFSVLFGRFTAQVAVLLLHLAGFISVLLLSFRAVTITFEPIVFLPVVSFLAMVFFFRGIPGTGRLNMFVAVSILHTLLLPVVVLIAAF